MEEEIEDDVWELKDIPKGQKAVGVLAKWVFDFKTDAEGFVEIFNPSRACSTRFLSEIWSGLSWDIFPFARLESIRTVIVLAVRNDLKLDQIDVHVTTAFLNSELKEEMYINQPEVFVIKDQACISCVIANNIAIGEEGKQSFSLRQ